MLPRLILELFLSLAKGLVWLGYGSDGMKARAIAGKQNKLAEWILTFMLGLLMIATVIIFTVGRNDGNFWLYILGFYVCPVALYIAWVFYARKSVEGLILQHKDEIDNLNRLEKKLRMGYKKWTCCSCGKKNKSTSTVCKDCGADR